MKKIVLILLSVTLCTIINLAHAEDVVYLKNGSVIRGYVVEHVPNSVVKIETSEGNIHKFYLDEVERIEFTPHQRPKVENPSFIADGGDFLKKGFRAFVEGAVDVQVDEDTYDGYNGYVSLPLTVGYQVNRFLFVGAGIAPGISANSNRYYYDVYYDYYDDYYYGRTAYDSHFVMPIYGALRVDFVNAKVSPFLDLRAGYGVTDYSRGAYASVAVGCRINHINLSMGYSYQDRKDYDNFNHVSFRVGYEF